MLRKVSQWIVDEVVSGNTNVAGSFHNIRPWNFTFKWTQKRKIYRKKRGALKKKDFKRKKQAEEASYILQRTHTGKK